MSDSEDLLTFFKALADANRLKIVGLLARQSYTVEQLAGLLNISPSTVSHHLSRLAEAGLVTASAQSYYNYYRLQNEQFEAMARRLTDSEAFPVSEEAAAGEALSPAQTYDQKVLRNYTLPNGKLKGFPSQRKKFLALLRHLVQQFEVGRRYTEPEVNEILSRFHEDTAYLRRGLISEGMMKRENNGQAYWRTEFEPPAA